MVQRRKKKRTVQPLEIKEGDGIPRSFVLHRGTVGKTARELMLNIRKVMEPYTATSLQVKRKNVLKDFVHISGPLGITHMIVGTRSAIAPNLRIIKLARGPTLTFRIHEYSLMRDVTKAIRRPKCVEKLYTHAPLLVLNNFNGESMEVSLMSTIFQNMFPAINLQDVRLAEIRRCVLINYDPSTKMIDFRHYCIEAVPAGLSRGVRKLVRARIPDLSNLQDISDFVLSGGVGMASESEGEDPTDAQVTLPQNFPGQGNFKSGRSAVRLTEIGPRIAMQLIKIEDGICTGSVLFHQYIKKSRAEIEQIQKRKQEKNSLRQQRKKKQEDYISKKKKMKEEHRERCLAGMKQGDTELVSGSHPRAVPSTETLPGPVSKSRKRLPEYRGQEQTPPFKRKASPFERKLGSSPKSRPVRGKPSAQNPTSGQNQSLQEQLPKRKRIFPWKVVKAGQKPTVSL